MHACCGSLATTEFIITISQRRGIGSISKAMANGTIPKKPPLPPLPRKKRLPGVATTYKYKYKQLPPSLRNEEMLRQQTAGLGVPVMPRQPTLSVVDCERRFPIRRVFCVGSNYRAHAEEMGNDPDQQPPFFFNKPADAAIDTSRSNMRIAYPQKTNDLQHEVELVVAIGKTGREVQPEKALKYVFGVAVGVDLTRRDLQREATALGRPWDAAKGFDCSAPVGAITPLIRAALSERDYKANEMEARREWKAAGGLGVKKEQGEFVDLKDRTITLSVDGEIKQSSKLGEMLWSIEEMVSRLSQLYTIEPGDIIFTGTPAGVGSLESGQEVVANIQGLPQCIFKIADPLQPTVVPHD